MNLRHLTDKSLLNDTKKLAGEEREISLRMLQHLKEIDRRKLYSDLGFKSLFAYCTLELKYSESSAHRRIQASRALAEIPEMEKKIERGSISLTNASLLNQFFKDNEIEAPKEKLKVVERIENLSTRECEKELFRISGKPNEEVKDNKRRISDTKIRYTITLSDETTEMLDEVKGLINKSVSLDELIMLIAVKARDQLKKEKFKLNKTRNSPPAPNVNRVIPASVKKEVYLRDKKCTRCGTTHNLQYDHRTPYSHGGSSSSENIRLLCFNCNQRARMRNKL